MLIRVLALAVWVALLDMWLAHHFQAGVSLSGISMLIGVPLGGLWCAGVIDFLVTAEEKEKIERNFKTYARDFIRTHLSTRILVVLFIVSGLLSCFFSSVIIGPVEGGGPRALTLQSATAHTRENPVSLSAQTGEQLRLWMNPLNTEYKIVVEGYLPKIIKVKPVFGTTIIPSRDLTQVPTVLFRPSSQSYLALGRGWFELYYKTDSGFVKIAEDQGTHAWYIGPRRNQNNELRAEWQLEAQAQNLNTQHTSILMRRWRNPKALNIEKPVGPGTVVCALATTIDRVAIAGVVGTITRNEYIDLPLGEYLDEASDPQSGDAVCRDLDTGAS